MSRVSGWYKRKLQVITLILAILATGLTNADTLLIVKRLYTDSALRAAVVAQAQEFAKQPSGISVTPSEKASEPSSPPSTGEKSGVATAQPTTPAAGDAKETFTQTLDTLQQLGLPLGWEIAPKKEEWLNKIIGLLLTVLAVSLGAPFWFDVLNRVAKIRSTGSTVATATKEGKTENSG